MNPVEVVTRLQRERDAYKAHTERLAKLTPLLCRLLDITGEKPRGTTSRSLFVSAILSNYGALQEAVLAASDAEEDLENGLGLD